MPNAEADHPEINVLDEYGQEYRSGLTASTKGWCCIRHIAQETKYAHYNAKYANHDKNPKGHNLLSGPVYAEFFTIFKN
ncbi:hypothetical protein ACVWWQ_003231 [Rhodanobacter sp. TND4EL1]